MRGRFQRRCRDRDQAAGRSVEVEGHEQEQRHERAASSTGDEPAAEEGDVQREQPERDRRAEHLEQSTAPGTRLLSAASRVVCWSIVSLRLST